MLEVQSVTKSYGKNIAIDQVSFVIPDGKIGILLGPNGAGKSTIIKCIAGLLKYTGGIGIHKSPSYSMEAKEIFAYVPEIPAMFPALTVYEHVQYIIKAYNSKITKEQVDAILRRFELVDKKDKLGDELSKGMMQKVSICCALAIMPKVILLDEPMVGLDPKAIKELKEVIKELKEQGTTVLISTHMLDMVKEIWDIMFIMESGRIIASYSKEEVEGQDLDELFFHITEGDKE